MSGLRVILEAEPWAFASARRVTASFGVAESLADEPLATVLERAGRAHYQAKRGGRNRVVAAG